MAFEIYPFGTGEAVDLKGENPKNLLGGKGAGLHWMTSIGVSVPPGFVIPTTAWAEYKKAPVGTMKNIRKQIQQYLAKLVDSQGHMPLLSVRSGARVSCPGMMDTILNVGIDEASEGFWKKKLGDAAYEDSLHRLITMYGSVVKGIDRKTLEIQKNTAEALSAYAQMTKEEFPSFEDQLLGSIEAVFKSWDNERAKIYRKMHGYKDEWGTAVTVQAMVFGNLNDQSGTGVLFTRNPDTGEDEITGEFLVNAQGEDVVAGIRTPMPLSKMAEWNKAVSDELMETVTKLEVEKRDVQDCEFTVQDGKLYLLQTRDAKRTPRAALKIVLDMVNDGVLTKAEAVKRLSPKEFDLAPVPVIDPSFKKKEALKGLPACSGVVCGKPVFTSKAAIASKVPCILITEETTPDDIGGMNAALGVITMTGGATSHAAVVARGMNKPCITGVGVDLEKFKESQVVAMDGATGRIWFVAVPTVAGDMEAVETFRQMMYEVSESTPIIFEMPLHPMKEALLYIGSEITPDEALAKVLSCAAQVETLYVDLMPETEEEKLFVSMFPDAKASIVAKMEEMSGLQNVILLGAKSKKLKTLGTTADIEAAVLATSGIAVTGNLSPAMLKVLEWKKAEGIESISIGKKQASGKSMCSFEELMHSGS